MDSRATAVAIRRETGVGVMSAAAALEGLDELLRPARTYARGEPLFFAGAPTSLYLVESGSVKLSCLCSDGAEQIVGFAFAGDLLGFDAVGGSFHSCEATALETTRARALALAELTRGCRGAPRLWHRFLQLASQRITELEQQMLMLGKKNALERLAGFLLGLSTRQASRGQPATELRLSMSRYAIGCYLGLAMETVSRLIKHLEAQGIIGVRGREVHILDLERLRLAAAEAPAHYPKRPS